MKKLVQTLIESYPLLRHPNGKVVPGNSGSTVGGPNGFYRASYILFSNDEKEVLQNIRVVCHAKLTQKYTECPKENTFDQLLTAYNADSAIWFTFFDFLTGHLFKQWAQYIHLNKDPKTGLHYIHVTDLDKWPAQVLYSFCIHSRIPCEFMDYIKAWQKMVKKGIDPSFAFALCRVVVDADGVATDQWGSDSVGHWPQYRTLSLKRLVSGKPVWQPNVMYKSHPYACTPCNSIWGETQDLRKLPGQTIEAFWNNWKEKHADLLLAS